MTNRKGNDFEVKMCNFKDIIHPLLSGPFLVPLNPRGLVCVPPLYPKLLEGRPQLFLPIPPRVPGEPGTPSPDPVQQVSG